MLGFAMEFKFRLDDAGERSCPARKMRRGESSGRRTPKSLP